MMEVIKAILGLILALCSLAQADKLEVIEASPNDQVQLSVTLVRLVSFIVVKYVTGVNGNENRDDTGHFSRSANRDLRSAGQNFQLGG